MAEESKIQEKLRLRDKISGIVNDNAKRSLATAKTLAKERLGNVDVMLQTADEAMSAYADALQLRIQQKAAGEAVFEPNAVIAVTPMQAELALRKSKVMNLPGYLKLAEACKQAGIPSTLDINTLGQVCIKTEVKVVTNDDALAAKKKQMDAILGKLKKPAM